MRGQKNTEKIPFVLDEMTLPILKQVAEEMPGGFFVYHADGDKELIFSNSAMLRIFGCDSEEEFRELTGNTFRGLVYPEDLESVEQSIANQIENSVYDLDYVEYRIVRKDKSVRRVENYGRFLHTRQYGDIFCVFIEDATVRTEERAAEMEKIHDDLKNAFVIEERYKKAILYDAVSLFKVNLTRDEFITAVSHNHHGQFYGMFDMMQMPPSYKYSEYIELRQKDVDQDRLSEYRQFFDIDRLVRCYYRGENDQTFDGWMMDLHGRRRLFHYTVEIGKNHYTNDIVALFITKDITEKAAQQNLLQIALKQAESANLARNTFLFNMSHDIRTPLNAIIGYTELVKNHISDKDKVLEYADKIRMSGEQLLSIVNESLEVTRMESGRVNLIENECHLTDLIASVEDVIRPGMKAKGIAFIIDRSGVQNFGIIADFIRIKEILCQLLDNAIKYTSPGGRVKLTVSELEIDLDGYGKYQFTVEDNGIGISDEFIGSLFAPFERANNTTQSGVIGTGLGLTLVKSLVDMMEGEIAVESKLFEGSTFTVSLLLKQQADQSSCEAATERMLGQDSLVGARILLVEDNEINAEIAEELLKTRGYLVETAQNGKIAVDMVKSSEPGYYALVLMDIQMPVMDGYEAMREIRKLEDERLSNIPIIALSANAFAEDYYKSIEAGADSHFPKPIDINSLQETICSVLSLHK